MQDLMLIEQATAGSLSALRPPPAPGAGPATGRAGGPSGATRRAGGA